MKLHKSLFIPPVYMYTELKECSQWEVSNYTKNYFVDFINPFPGHNIPQTSDVTTIYGDTDKIKTMFFSVKL